jgi:hypothetical protein
MATIRTPDDGSPSKRKEAAQTWLGRNARDSQRLARVFQVGQAVRVAELEAELGALRAKLDSLEEELWSLRRHPGDADALLEKASETRLVDLPRVLLPRERDYQLARSEGFAVFAGAHALGVVEGARYHSRTDRPDVLEVRSGGFNQRLLLIPVSEVETINPDDEAVIVNEACRPPQPRSYVRAYLERFFPRR